MGASDLGSGGTSPFQESQVAQDWPIETAGDPAFAFKDRGVDILDGFFMGWPPMATQSGLGRSTVPGLDEILQSQSFLFWFLGIAFLES